MDAVRAFGFAMFVLKIIGGLLAVALIWVFQLVVFGALFAATIFSLRALALLVHLDPTNPPIMWTGVALSFLILFVIIVWLEKKAKRYGLDFLFTWLPF